MDALRRYRNLILLGLAAGIAGLLAKFVSHPAAAAFVALALLPLIPLAALRFLASIFLLVATLALVSDATPALTDGEAFDVSTFGEHWAGIAPASFNAAKTSITQSGGPWLWEGPVTGILGWPTFLLFGSLAFVCGYAGRRRREVTIFVN